MSRKPHEPDEKTRKTVEAMASYGIVQDDIAAVLEIDDKTLRKYYSYELATATAKANSQVAQRLYNKCMNDDTSSIIFWLKTRGQWADTTQIRHADANGNKLQFADILGALDGRSSGLPEDKGTTS